MNNMGNLCVCSMHVCVGGGGGGEGDYITNTSYGLFNKNLVSRNFTDFIHIIKL